MYPKQLVWYFFVEKSVCESSKGTRTTDGAQKVTRRVAFFSTLVWQMSCRYFCVPTHELSRPNSKKITLPDWKILLNSFLVLNSFKVKTC